MSRTGQPEARRPPHHCPVCGENLALTRLGCQACGTELSGVFQACEFCALGPEQRQVLRVFLTSGGNLKELQRHLGVSYPTARARFEAVLGTLGLDRAAPQGPGRLEVLQALARGEIDVDEAERRLATPG